VFVSFLGSPCSGKTTTSAMVYALLKEQGVSIEFINEQARSYITTLRYQRQKRFGAKISLSLEDQIEIMHRQLQAEKEVLYCTEPDVVVLTDSSVFNALIYMTPEEHKDQRVTATVSEAQKIFASNKSFVYRASPVLTAVGHDAIRAHNQQESAVAESRLDAVVAEYLTPIGVVPSLLSGPPKRRQDEVYGNLLSELVKDL
jgi:thymidylate kinase